MKTAILFAAATILLASGCQSYRLTSDDLIQKRAQQENITGALYLGRITVRQETHEKVFAIAENLSKQHDPSEIGVKVVIPPQYRKRYEQELKNTRVTMSLGPRLTMKQFMAEFPFDSWRLCYWAEGVVILIPIDSVK